MINAFCKFFPHSKSVYPVMVGSCLFFYFPFFYLLDDHERWYYELYDDDYFYTEIRNGLNALVSLNVDNFRDATRELRNFCSRTHHPTSAPLCECCEITKNLIEEVENEEHPETLLFYRTSSYFYDD